MTNNKITNGCNNKKGTKCQQVYTITYSTTKIKITYKK